jgi:signal transduction histidine kinase
MLNLLSNAIKFTRTGGEVGISVRVTADKSLRISVADTGIGMDEAGLRRASEPFGRVNDDQYGPTEGTGLGLPIARGLIALHGGRLEIESAPGAGTTVNLFFPPARLIPADD